MPDRTPGPTNRVPNPAAPGDGRDDRAREGGEAAEPMGRVADTMVRAVDALPDWMGSIRFRLTALYSLVLFGLAAFMVAGLYAVLATRLGDDDHYVSRDITLVREVPGGVEFSEAQLQTRYQTVEEQVNERALGLLRTYSLTSLGLLFLASLGVGWLVAGRVLAPIGRITAVARDIQATEPLERASPCAVTADGSRVRAATRPAAMPARLDRRVCGLAAASSRRPRTSCATRWR